MNSYLLTNIVVSGSPWILYADKHYLEGLWNSGNAPWKVVGLYPLGATMTNEMTLMHNSLEEEEMLTLGS